MAKEGEYFLYSLFMEQEGQIPKGFKIEHLFGSRTRARLMSVFIHRPDDVFFVRELTRKIDAQLNSVRRELKNLLGMGLVQEADGLAGASDSKHKPLKKRYYRANPKCVFFSDLRGLLQKIHLLMKKNLVQQIDQQGRVLLLLLTGRFLDRRDAPVDVLVVGHMDEALLQKILGAFEKECGYEVNYTVMTKEEYGYRKQVADRFLHSILETNPLIMIDRLSVTNAP